MQVMASKGAEHDQKASIIEKHGDDSIKSSPDRDMTTYSQHCFDSTGDGFSISVIENMKEEYGLFVWPSSVILAEYVWQQKSRFSGACVVELGAGTSLPGLVAAKVGADVTLTDDVNKAEVLSNMRRVCNINDLKCKVLGLTWGVFDAPIFTLHPSIILGADVLYDSSAFDDLFATVTFLLQKCPDSVFITTYHNRSGHHLIEFLMEKWRLKCTKLLDGFSFLPSHKALKNMKEEYGLFVWPSSVILAEFVWQQKSRFSGACVVELRRRKIIDCCQHVEPFCCCS